MIWESIQGGMPQTNTQGIMDLLKSTFGGPMEGQQYIQGALPGMTDTGVGQQNMLQILQGLGAPGEAEQRLMNLSRQATSGDAGLDPYYDNAIRRAQEDITQQTSALGAYGSSAGQALGAEATTNLLAEKANREAQHKLQQLGIGIQGAGTGGALGLQRQGLSGELGLAGDRIDVDKQGMAIDAALGLDAGTTARMLGLVTGATGADQSNINELLGLSNIFATGSVGKLGRATTGYGSVDDYTTDVSNLVSTTFQSLSQGDQDLVMAILSGPPQEAMMALESGRYGRAENMDGVKNLLGMATGIPTAGSAWKDFLGGGGGGGSSEPSFMTGGGFGG
jgi:hypothetical protein